MHETFMARKNILIIPPRLFGAAAIIIVLAQLALIWTHVPWHDELQAVLLARDTNTLTQWYTNFRYEGHPPLWHFLLKLMLVFFNEPTALRAATSVATLATAWLIYRKAPFGPWVKLLISLNYFIFFEYAAIARGYCLGVFFTFAAIAWRAHPVSWLFAALIPQAGANMIFFPGVFAAIMIVEKRWSWAGAILCALGVTLALVWMTPAPDAQTLGTLTRDLSPLARRLLRTAIVASDIIFPLNMDGNLVGWVRKLRDPVLAELLIGASLPILIHAIARTNLLMTAAMSLFTIFTFALSTLAVELNLRHFGFIVIMVIAHQWVTVDRGLPLNWLAGAWFTLLALSGLGAAFAATRAPFSPSRMVADHIARTIEPDRLLIPIDTLLGVEITAFTGRPTFNLTNQCLQTFVQWKGPVFMVPDTQSLTVAAQTLAEKRKALDILKTVAARAGGKALVILDRVAGDSLHWIADDPALHYDRYLQIGGPTSHSGDRYLYRIDVPPDPNPAPIPPCIR